MSGGQDERSVRAAYDVVAATYADVFRATEPEQQAELAVVERFAGALPGRRRVLDAGCGAGRMLPLLAGLGCDPQGVDLSPAMVACARRDHPAWPTAVASLTRLPYADASFDGWFSWYSTIHASDDDLVGILAEARRVLRPGGLALVAFQSGTGVRDVAPAYRRVGHEVSLVRFNRTPAEVGEALAAVGFTGVTGLERPAVGGERDAQAVVLAEMPADGLT